tara:strand:- start:17 stop:511 length:495 start_codon:yes stop_codon:yes gene_type:complete
MKQLLITIVAVVLVGCGPRMSIHEAATEGNIEVVKQHIAAGTDVNAKDKYGVSPLHNAATWGHNEIAELLIDKGADVNAKNKYGSTSLHNAAANNRKEVVELLITEGADVNAKDDKGYTPLDWVALRNWNHTKIPDILRKHGAKFSGRSLETRRAVRPPPQTRR